MANAFNLTAQLNLRGPNNIKPVVGKIRKQLGSINTNVNLTLNKNASKTVQVVTNRLKAMNNVLVSSKSHVNELNASFAALSTSLGNVQRNSQSITKDMSQVNKTAATSAKELKQAANAMEDFGKQSFLAVKRFAAFSIVSVAIYGVVNAIQSGFKAFVDFDRQLIRLQQVTGAGALGIKELSDEITNLAKNLGVSSSSLAEVSVTLAQAGLTARQTKDALAAIAKTDLAPTFDNMTDTTEGAIAAMRQFNIAAKDLEGTLGSINAVAASFAVESSDIIKAIQRAGSVFASSSKGVSTNTEALKEFIAVFTAVRSTTRESAETIATGLRTVFTRIQRPQTIKFLRQYGVELTDIEGKFVGPYEAAKRLSDVLGELDPRDLRFGQIVEELGGFRQINKVIPILQNFSTAQQALNVARKGSGSLTKAQEIAEQSLAVQLAKVREEFLALIKTVGQSKTFQTFFSFITKITSGLIKLAGVFKPILPALAILGTLKIGKAALSFGGGFLGSFKKGGGSKAVGRNLGETVTGTKDKTDTSEYAAMSEAIKNNTDALTTLTGSLESLTTKVDALIVSVDNNTAGGGESSTFSGGGKVLGFNRGGVVPGSGRGDKVRAMLEPGEVVMSNQAAQKYGRGNLVRMNKYAEGGKSGKLFRSDKNYGMLVAQKENPPNKKPGDVQFTDPKTNNSYTAGLRISGFKQTGTFDEYASGIDDAIDTLDSQLAKSLKETTLIPSITKKAKVATANAKGYMFENYVLKAAKLPDPNSNIFDITRSNKELKAFTDEPVVGLTDIKLGNNPEQQARVIDKARRAKPEDFKEVSENFEKLKKGGIIQKFPNGSPGGVQLGPGRGKGGPRESYLPRGFKILDDEEYAAFSEKAYREAGKYGGSGWDMTHKPPLPWPLAEYNDTIAKIAFSGIEIPTAKPFDSSIDPKIIAMLEAQGDVLYGTGYGDLAKGQPAYETTELLPFRYPKGAKDPKQRKMDARTLRKMVATAGGVDSSSLENVPMDVLLKYAEQAPRAPKEALEATIARYQKDPATKGGFLKRFEQAAKGGEFISGKPLLDEIPDIPERLVAFRKSLEEKLLEAKGDEKLRKSITDKIIKTSNAIQEAKDYQNGILPTVTGRASHFAWAMRQAIPESKNFANGGLVQKFAEGGVSSVSELIGGPFPRNFEPEDGKSWRQILQEILQKSSFVLDDKNNITVGDQVIPLRDALSPRKLTAKNFRQKVGETTIPRLENIRTALLSQYDAGKAEVERRSDFTLTDEEKAAAQEIAIAGIRSDRKDLAPFYRKRDGVPLYVHSGIIKEQDYADVEELWRQYYQTQMDAANRIAGRRGQTATQISEDERKTLGIANAQGYDLEVLLAALGSTGGKRSSQDAIDFAQGLSPLAASVFGVPPGIPTQAKLTITSKSMLDAVSGIIRGLAFGGPAEGPGFEEVRQQIMDKYQKVEWRISKRKRGFGYNLMGALKSAGGLSGDSSLNFQQPTNLKQLQEYADKIASKLMNPEQLAVGGSSSDTVPAMVSNNEGFVPPKLAQRIGYAKLDKMNQADRNGMTGFAEGGISKFKGPGSGTSDSIGPIGLPKGSYVIRAKAMNAMNFNKGGFVGTQKFVDGGDVTASREWIKVIQQIGEATEIATSVTDFLQALEEISNNLRDAGKIDLAEQVDKLVVSAESGDKEAFINNLTSSESGRASLRKSEESEEEAKPAFDKLAEVLQRSINTQELFADSAEAAGVSVQKFTKDVKAQIIDKALSGIGARQQARSSLKSEFLKARLIDPTDTKKMAKSEDRMKKQLSVLLEDPAQIDDALQALVSGARDGSVSLKETALISTGLTSALNSSLDSGAALATATNDLEEQLGGLTEAAKATQEELENIEFTQSGEASDTLGLLGRLNPRLARDLQGSRSLSAAQSVTSGGRLGNMLSKSIDKLPAKISGPLKLAIKNIGGPSGALAVGASMIGDQLPQVFKRIGLGRNTTAAGVAGALQEGGSRAASMATIGNQIAGPLGAAIGLITGAISGAIDGFMKAFRAKQLENSMVALDKASTKATEALEMLTSFDTEANFQEAAKATDVLRDSITDLGEQSKVGFSGVASGAIEGAGYGAMTGAMIGNFIPIPGVGAGIGAAVGAIVGGLIGGITSYFSSDEISEAAFAGQLKAIDSYVSGIQQLAERRINLQSLEDIDEFLNRINEAKTPEERARVAEGGFIVQEAQRAALVRQGAKIKQSDSVEDFVYNRGMTRIGEDRETVQDVAGQAKEDIAVAYAMRQLNQLYDGNKEAIEREAADKEKLIKTGLELIAVEDKRMAKEAQMALAMKAVNMQTEELIEKFRKMEATTQKFSDSLEMTQTRVQSVIAASSGQATSTATFRADEKILANPLAATDEEFSKVVSKVGALAGGGENSQQLVDTLNASRMVQTKLPDLLRGASQQNVGGVVTELEQILKDGGISGQALTDVVKEVRESLEKETSGREGKGFNELLQDFPALQAAMKTQEAAVKTASQLLAYNNSRLQEYGNILDEINNATRRQIDIQYKADQIRLEYAEKLARMSGKTSEEPLDTPVTNRVIRLTAQAGIAPTTDPTRIGDALIKAIEEQQKIQQQRTETVDPTEQLELQKQESEIASVINNLSTALDDLANNTERTAQIMKEFEQVNRELNAIGSVGEKLLTSDPTQLLDFNNQQQNLSRFLSGDQQFMEMIKRPGNVKLRQDVFSALDFTSQFMSPEEAAKQRREITLRMLEMIPGGEDVKARIKELQEEEEIKKKELDEEAKRRQEALGKQIEVQNALIEALENNETTLQTSMSELTTAIEQLNQNGVTVRTQAATQSAARDAESKSSTSENTGFRREARRVVVQTSRGTRSRIIYVQVPITSEDAKTTTATSETQAPGIESQRGNGTMPRPNIPQSTETEMKDFEEAAFAEMESFVRGPSNTNTGIPQLPLSMIEDTKKPRASFDEIQSFLEGPGFTPFIPQPAITTPLIPTVPTEQKSDIDRFFGNISSSNPLPVKVINVAEFKEIMQAREGSTTNPVEQFNMFTTTEAKAFLSDFTQTIGSFKTYIDNLQKIMNVPVRIDIVGRHTVDVRITGAAAFEALKEDFYNLIVSEVDKKMKDIWSKTGGQLGSPGGGSRAVQPQQYF